MGQLLVLCKQVKLSQRWRKIVPISRGAAYLNLSLCVLRCAGPNFACLLCAEPPLFFPMQVLIAPITEQGQVQRDIYLPGEDHLWMDTNTAQVFDGGTVIRNYSVKIAEVPVFVKVSSMPDCPRFPSSTGE